MFRLNLLLTILLCSGQTWGDELSDYDQCVIRQVQLAGEAVTIEQIRQGCLAVNLRPIDQTSEDERKSYLSDGEMGAFTKRRVRERIREFDPFVITPHRINYILPIYTSNSINVEPYEDIDGFGENMEDVEAKFQISLKVPLNPKSLLVEGDALYFGFTVEAWWQVYANNISKPFRETNYRPELFYFMPLNLNWFKGVTGLSLGIEHQSNGRSEQTSRSWNRAYFSVLYEHGNLAMSVKPWWRIPEEPDEYPGDPDGDDNPDIEKYMGHFELGSAYIWGHFELNSMLRYNFSTSKGALEVGFIFPMWGRLRGYTSVFTGYGDSLMDYNHAQTRFGLGIALTSYL